MDPIPKMLIQTPAAKRKGQVEVASVAEIDELITALIIAKTGMLAAVAAIGAAAVVEAERDEPQYVVAAQDIPGSPCWCGHAERVHNTVGHSGGRSFCTECEPGRCGRYEPARAQDKAAMCQSCGIEAATEGGFCEACAPAAVLATGSLTAPGPRPADGCECGHQAADHHVHSVNGNRTYCNVCAVGACGEFRPRPAARHLKALPDDGVADAVIYCGHEHPSKHTGCIGPDGHKPPCRDSDGDEWVPHLAEATR